MAASPGETVAAGVAEGMPPVAPDGATSVRSAPSCPRSAERLPKYNVSIAHPIIAPMAKIRNRSRIGIPEGVSIWLFC